MWREKGPSESFSYVLSMVTPGVYSIYYLPKGQGYDPGLLCYNELTCQGMWPLTCTLKI